MGLFFLLQLLGFLDVIKSYVEYQNSSRKMKPIEAKESDMKEIGRQIYECSDAKLKSKFEGTEYPKHCSPCFLFGKPGSDAKRLVVNYSIPNK